MINLPQRQSVILELLCEAGRPMTGAELSDLLGVGLRTVRNDIRWMNRAARTTLVVSGPHGYSVNAVGYRDVVNRGPMVAGGAEDERLLTYLLDVVRCSIYDLSLDCYLSEGAARSALIRLTPLLHQCGLDLTIQGSTITIAGDELGRRRLLGSLVREAIDARIGSQRWLSRLLPDVPLATVEAAIRTALEDSPIQMSDIAQQNLAVNLAICLQRAGSAPVYTGDDEQIAGDATHVADRLVSLLGAAFPQRLRRASDATAVRQLTAAALVGAPVAALGDDKTSLDHLIGRAVDECVEHFHLIVQRDRLIASLTDHTRRLIARNETFAYFRSGLRESLRTRSPFLYDVAVYLAHLISGPLGLYVTDDEISLLAIYLGLYAERPSMKDAVTVAVVCPRYQTLREWLLRHLAQDLGERIDILDVAASVPEAKTTGAELIVSTLSGSGEDGTVVEISALCSEFDLEAVRSAVTQTRERRTQGRTAQLLSRFLDPRLFFVDVQMPDSDAAIDFLCAQLVATGKVPDDFAASVKIREEYSPTAFVHRFAVPHAMEFMAYETTIAVLIPRQPIHWGESDVVMVLMLAINRDGIAEFSAAYQPLVHLLCQPDIFAQVHSLREFDDFQRFLTEKVAEIE